MDGVTTTDSSIAAPEYDNLDNNTSESSQLISGSNSQGPEAPSIPSSTTTTRSAEERLRQIRAAEDAKQRQLHAAMIEAQRQADLTRKKLQEDRRRKIEAMRQREEARRNSVLERRKELELCTQARLDLLRQRSLSRTQDVNLAPSSTGRHPTCVRTASAAPAPDSNRYPSQLMTSSCLVAFGSSAPRSICTQLSPAALRLKQAFEARLASYLTGRHSGCFLTPSALPHYSLLMDADSHRHPSHESQEQVSRAIATVSLAKRRYQHNRNQNAQRMTKRRTVSAHPPLSHKPDRERSRGGRLNRGGNTAKDMEELRAEKVMVVVTTPDRKGKEMGFTRRRPAPGEVSSVQSNSTQEFQRLGRNPRAVTAASGGKQALGTDSSAPTSARSASVEILGSKKTTAPSVFQRLYAPKQKNSGTALCDGNDTEHLSDGDKGSSTNKRTTQFRKPMAPTMPRTKTVDTTSTLAGNDKKGSKSGRHDLPRVMSSSMYVERTVPRPNIASRVPKSPTSPASVASDLGVTDAHTGKHSGGAMSQSGENQFNTDIGPPTPTSIDTSQPTTPSAPDDAGADTTASPTVHAEPSLPVSPVPVQPNADSTNKELDSTSSSPPTDSATPLNDTDGLQQPPAAEPLGEQTSAGICNGTSASSASPVGPMHTGPLKAETRGSGDGGHLSESEAAIYRAKLVEQRRLAKERKEQEQRRLEEENRIRRERQEEARIAAEKALQTKMEAAAREAQHAAEEAEEQQRIRRQEELAKLQMLEAERAAKLQQAEEERVLRKKRLDNIMSRVKPSGSNTNFDNNSNSSSASNLLLSQTTDEDPQKTAAKEVFPNERVRDLAEPLTEKSLPSDDHALKMREQNTSAADVETMAPLTFGERELGSNSHSPPDMSADTPKNGEINGSLDRPRFYSPQETNSPPNNDKLTDQGDTCATPVDGLGDRVVTGVETENGLCHVASAPPPSLQGLHTTVDGDSSPQRQPSVPKFKSALLQSMLGGGRLATHAKDAVADLRRKSSSTSLDAFGDNTPVTAVGMVPAPFDGFSTMPRDTTLKSPLIGNFQTDSGDSPMIRSMFDRSLDRLHSNGSSSVH